MKVPLRLLLIEDSETDAYLLERHLLESGYDLTLERVETAEAMRNALRQKDWDLVVSGYCLPRFNAGDALQVLKKSGLDLPFIVFSEIIGEETAVEIMRAGAHDYVMKHNLARLLPVVDRELREAEGRRLRRQAEEALRETKNVFVRSFRMPWLAWPFFPWRDGCCR